MTNRAYRWITALVAAAMVPVPVTDVRSHGGATGVVKERMEMMERLDELMDRIFAMMHGELHYDANTMRRAAEEIRGAAGNEMTRLFPEGSDDEPSEARAEVWMEFATLLPLRRSARPRGRDAGSGGRRSRRRHLAAAQVG